MAATKKAKAKPSGTLSIVSTPIGNYDDITLRALETLKTADLIVCEEAKEANKLLARFEIDKEIIELNEHNDAEVTVEVVKLLSSGKNIALISDAGTPLLADPGDMLVTAAIKYNIPVAVLPGASSILTALVRCGFSTRQFLFAGFLSRKNNERNDQITQLAREPRTVILLDTPYRLNTVLAGLAAHMPERQAYIGVNLTMSSEAHYYGTFHELEKQFSEGKFRGEYVIVFEGNPDAESYYASIDEAPAREVSQSEDDDAQPMTNVREYSAYQPAQTDTFVPPPDDEELIESTPVQDNDEYYSDDNIGTFFTDDNDVVPGTDAESTLVENVTEQSLTSDPEAGKEMGESYASRRWNYKIEGGTKKWNSQGASLKRNDDTVRENFGSRRNFDRRNNQNAGRRDDRGGYDRRNDRGGYDNRGNGYDRRDDRGGYDRRNDRVGYDNRSYDNRGGNYDRRDDRGGYENRGGYDRRDDRGYRGNNNAPYKPNYQRNDRRNDNYGNRSEHNYNRREQQDTENFGNREGMNNQYALPAYPNLQQKPPKKNKW